MVVLYCRYVTFFKRKGDTVSLKILISTHVDAKHHRKFMTLANPSKKESLRVFEIIGQLNTTFKSCWNEITSVFGCQI